ncbi:MAG TPA: hypothetical protein VIK27_01970 [Candidatus Aquilonibacter sp.]
MRNDPKRDAEDEQCDDGGACDGNAKAESHRPAESVVDAVQRGAGKTRVE